MELQVSYKAGMVLVEPTAYFPEYERSVEVIAKGEQVLSAQHLKSIGSASPYGDLKAYFEAKGWEVIPVD